MPPTLPSPPAVFVAASSLLGRMIFTTWLGFAACHADPPPVPPGEPIPAAAEVELGTMDAECGGLVSALARYKQCANLDDDDRWSIEAWSDRAQEDFAAGKKANPEPNAQRAIAAACHKAVASVTAANERCHNGPHPQR